MARTLITTLYSGRAVEHVYNTSTAGDANDTTSFATGTAGGRFPTANLTVARTRRVRFSSAIIPSDLIIMQASPDNGVTWFNMNQFYYVFSGNAYGINSIHYLDSTPANTDSIGVGITVVNTTDADIGFGRYASVSLDNNVLVAWGSVPSTALWRVVRLRLT